MQRMTWALLTTICLLPLACGTSAVREGRPPAARTDAPARVATRAEPKATSSAPAETVKRSEPEDPDVRAVRELNAAAALFATFIRKAGDDPRYAEAVKRSRDRMEDIRSTLPFIEQGLAERRGR